VGEQSALEYQRAAGEIRSKISPSDVGTFITVPRIQELAGTTYSTALRTAKLLEAEGILLARHGRGYEVIAIPEDAAARTADMKALREEVAQLRAEVRRLSAQLERVESNVEDLHEKLGYDYEAGDPDERGEAPAPAAPSGRTG